MILYPNGLRTPPRITAGFGWRIHPITGKRTFHYGIDSIGHPDGLNYAPAAGVVAFAGVNGTAGWEVTVRDDDGNLWLIMHHAPGSLRVTKGDRVAAGQPVGTTGTSGGSTGIHCHLGLQIRGNHVDPYQHIAARLNTTAATTTRPLTADMETIMAIPFDLIADSKGVGYVVLPNGIPSCTALEFDCLGQVKAALLANEKNGLPPFQGTRLPQNILAVASEKLRSGYRAGN